MKEKLSEKIYETDLYKPIYDYLVKQGYTVYSEVKDCDISAVKGEELVIVEMKRSMNLTLLVQAAQRQKAADSVYVAVPRPKGGIYTSRWKDILHLLRRLELGLIIVSFTHGIENVEIAFHPGPFDREKSKKSSKKMRHSIIKEIDGRYGDFNVGGSSRRKLMTAYRESSIFIACCFEKFGQLSPKQLRELGTGQKTFSILSKNYYGWFEKIDKGLYNLSPEGETCLGQYPELTEHYRREIADKIIE